MTYIHTMVSLCSALEVGHFSNCGFHRCGQRSLQLSRCLCNPLRVVLKEMSAGGSRCFFPMWDLSIMVIMI